MLLTMMTTIDDENDDENDAGKNPFLLSFRSCQQKGQNTKTTVNKTMVQVEKHTQRRART